MPGFVPQNSLRILVKKILNEVIHYEIEYQISNMSNLLIPRRIQGKIDY